MSEEVAASNEVTALNGIASAAAARHRAGRTLRMYDLTVPRHELHEESFCDYEAEADRRRRGEPPRAHSCCDCTHFCYTPQFWAAVWDRMAGELDHSHVAQKLMHHTSLEHWLELKGEQPAGISTKNLAHGVGHHPHLHEGA
jgi:hypothetical protein